MNFSVVFPLKLDHRDWRDNANQTRSEPRQEVLLEEKTARVCLMNEWCSQHNSRVKWRIHYKRLETISERWRSNHTLSPLFLADDITAVEFMSDISYTTSNSMSEATLQRLCKKTKPRSVSLFTISRFLCFLRFSRHTPGEPWQIWEITQSRTAKNNTRSD